jgi:hypothetical protein
VRGFADQRLLLKDDPTNPSNRRISIIVRNQGWTRRRKDGHAPAAAPPLKACHTEKAAAVMLPPTSRQEITLPCWPVVYFCLKSPLSLLEINVQGDHVNRICTLTLMGALLGAAL